MYTSFSVEGGEAAIKHPASACDWHRIKTIAFPLFGPMVHSIANLQGRALCGPGLLKGYDQ
jgi:hypothetical protein